MVVQDLIAGLKRATLEEARAAALPITEGGERIGELVPVGPWVLDSPDVVAGICRWRQAAMRMFLVQFESTEERTRRYLQDLSIGQADRIFFLIHVDGLGWVGHAGFSGVGPEGAELDNLMRGERGGHPRLIHHAETTLLRWAFEVLRVPRITARVVSYNWLVIELHEQIGFTLLHDLPLRKVVQPDMTTHEVVDAASANVRYSCRELALTPEAFRAAVPRG